MKQYVAACLLLFFCYSCAGLPSRLPLTESEENAGVEALRQIIASQASCPDRLDVDVTLSYKRLLYSGVVAGYLQAMAPGYLRVEAVNPLGLTEFLFATDGAEFTLLNVRNQKGYVGRVETPYLERYVPGELDFASLYSWLVGRFSPETFTIVDIERSTALEYWAKVTYDNGQKTDRLLFSISQRRILQRIILNENEESRVRFVYDYDHHDVQQTTKPFDIVGGCAIPHRLIIDGSGRGEVSMTFNENYPDPQFDIGDFSIDIPTRFIKEIVK